MAHCWSIAKDALSLSGAILISVPWFSDFGTKRRLKSAGSIPSGLSLKQKIIELHRARLSEPSGFDFAVTLCGLIFLIFSFLVSLLQSLEVLPA